MKLDLSNFYGTENHYRWSNLFPNVLLTDGTYYVAQEAGAYWLMDVIASYLYLANEESFLIAELKLNEKDSSAVFLLMKDREKEKPIGLIAKQEIPFTDFPESISFYVSKSGDQWVVMLPTEY